MRFCASCGQPQDDAARFCATCGAEFSGDPAGDSTAAQDTTGASGPEPAPSDPTRFDLIADASRDAPGSPGGSGGPFASWYQPQAPAMPPGGLRDDASGQWEPTQTVTAAPGGAAGYPAGPTPPGSYPPGPAAAQAPTYPPAPPYPPAQQYPPAGQYPLAQPPGGPEHGRRGLFLVLTVIMVLAAGGGAYALATSLGAHSTAQPPATVSAGASSQPPATQPSAGPATPSAGPSTPASPSRALSLVALAPGVPASSASDGVETLLSHYFHGINSHSYPEYASTLTPAEQARQSQSTFNSGYATTADSGMTLTSLTSSGTGRTATVTFTSHQSAAQSVDHSTCNDWTLNLYLVAQGNGYLIGTAPAGYQPDHSDC